MLCSLPLKNYSLSLLVYQALAGKHTLESHFRRGTGGVLVRRGGRRETPDVLELDGGPEVGCRVPRAAGRALVIVGVGVVVAGVVDASRGAASAAEDLSYGVSGQAGRVAVLVLVVVVRVAGPQGLHLGLLPLAHDLVSAVLQCLDRRPAHRHLCAAQNGSL